MVAPSILILEVCNHVGKDKETQKKLRNEPDLQPAAIEEFIRLYTLYCGFAITSNHEVTIPGQVIENGDPITLTYAAVNRDPTVFP
jgi:cytochrome P450